MISFLNRALFSVRETGVAESIVKETIKHIPFQHRRRDCLTKESFQYVYDLINVTPVNNMLNAEGDLIAGSVSPLDLTGETPSTVAWSVYLPMLLFSALALVFSFLALALSVKLPYKIFLATLAESAANSGGFIASHFSAAGYFWLASIVINLPGALTLWAIAYYGYIVIAEVDPGRFTSTLYWNVALLLVFLSVVVPILGPLAVVALSVCASFSLSIRAIVNAKVRADKLEKAAHESRGLTYSDDFRLYLEAHKIQIDTALKRNLPLIHCGYSLGILRRNGDPYTPDMPKNGEQRGGPLCLDSDDMSLPIAVVGESGSGKTAFLLSLAIQFMHLTGINSSEKKRILLQHGKRMGGGCLILDGKGDIPLKLKEIANQMGIEDFMCVRPETHKLNLMAGFGDFTPGKFSTREEGIIRAIEDDAVFTKCLMKFTIASAQQNEQHKQEFFVNACQSTIHSALMLLSYGMYLRHNGCPDIRFERSLKGLFTLMLDEDYRNDFLNKLAENHMAEIKSIFALGESFKWFFEKMPKLPPATYECIMVTLHAGLSALIINPLLENWLGEESDLIISAELTRGKFIAVLSSEYRYGEAGLLAAALIEQEFLIKLQRRPFQDPLIAENEYDILLLADEYGSWISPTANVFSVGRSLGLKACVFFQSYDQIEARLGQAQAKAIWQLFIQTLTFRCRDQSLKYAVSGLKPISRLTRVNMKTKAGSLTDLVGAEKRSGIKNKSAGSLIESVANAFSSVNELTRKLSLHGHDRAQVESEADRLSVEEYTIINEPSINENELARYLSIPFVCLANTIRAGIPRRELIRITPYWELYPVLSKSTEAKEMMKEIEEEYGYASDMNSLFVPKEIHERR